jgi:hypothetical protein
MLAFVKKKLTYFLESNLFLSYFEAVNQTTTTKTPKQ